ncbi:hypothetical protein B0I00_1466 [Novosphingobium kunmingense]|uniref:Uncharacterized protein n=1 Tax=Novosphingobium kunmingense TaxID=1211806 RepID=A0A2N0HJV8_9SPHN|nr:hypothetical protein [Novosphingobium kunmingense]PKB19236.1 hypothetical protein B0I00_1466 [Novosphingobium kunmingense]
MSQGPEPVAWLNHDWTGGGTLLSYTPVPAETKRSGNELHDRFWGLSTRSPLTPYFTVWRDVARATVDDRKLGLPSRIGLFAQFGTDPWTPPPDLVEEASQRQMRDEGQISLGWRWADEETGYELDSLGLQINRAGQARPFRSFHRGAELAMLDVVVAPILRPDGADAPIGFHVSGQLRERYNSGEAPKGDPVRFTAMGTAAAMPGWMMY